MDQPNPNSRKDKILEAIELEILRTLDVMGKSKYPHELQGYANTVACLVGTLTQYSTPPPDGEPIPVPIEQPSPA